MNKSIIILLMSLIFAISCSNPEAIIEKEIKIPKTSKITLLKPIEVYYNLRAYKLEPFLNYIHVPIHQFKDSSYSELSVIVEDYENKQWVQQGKTLVFKGGEISPDLQFNGQQLTIRRFNSGFVSFDYTSNGRLKARKYYHNIGGLGSVDNYYYPNDSNVDVIMHEGDENEQPIHLEYNSNGNLKTYEVKYSSKLLYWEYEYDQNNLLKQCTKYLNSGIKERKFLSKLSTNYVFNKNGDWIELRITDSYGKHSPSKESRIRRVFK